MTWQQPLAFVGLLALALPLLIHLLGRDRAKSVRFPSLRFVDATRLLPTRRTRLHDLPLLVVRLALLAAAVSALAEPRWTTAEPRKGKAATIAQVIIVDTSASMRLPSPTGERKVDVARARAKAMTARDASSLLIESANPRQVMGGAVAWLQQQPTNGALTILSDFQTGTVDAASFTAVPATIAVSLERVRGLAPDAPVVTSAWFGDHEVIARSTPKDSTVTEVRWSVTRGDQSSRPAVLVLGRADEQPRLTVARAAADAILPVAGQSGSATASAANTASTDTSRGLRDDALGETSMRPSDSALAHASEQRVTIMTTAYHAQPSLASDTVPPSAAWTIDAVAALRTNRALQSAAHDSRRALPRSANTPVLRGLTVLRDGDQHPLVVATEPRVTQQGQLHLIVTDDVSAVTLATLIAAARDLNLTFSPDNWPTSRDELEWDSLADSTLARWQRDAGGTASAGAGAGAGAGANLSAAKPTTAIEHGIRADRASDGESNGRWLWAAVLLLTLMETFVRKRTSPDIARA